MAEISFNNLDRMLDICLCDIRNKWKNKCEGKENPLKLDHLTGVCPPSPAMVCQPTMLPCGSDQSPSQNLKEKQPDSSFSVISGSIPTPRLPEGCVFHIQAEGDTHVFRILGKDDNLNPNLQFFQARIIIEICLDVCQVKLCLEFLCVLLFACQGKFTITWRVTI